MLKVNSMENVVPGWSSSLIATSFIGGIQFILLGVIGKYIENIYGDKAETTIYNYGKNLPGSKC